jgi:hypothetical protein
LVFKFYILFKLSWDKKLNEVQKDARVRHTCHFHLA